jgi:hypothetical protein
MIPWRRVERNSICCEDAASVVGLEWLSMVSLVARGGPLPGAVLAARDSLAMEY